MRFGGFITAVLAALIGAGCLYTDGVNGEPQARISKQTPGPHYIDSRVIMEAFESTDPDNDFLTASWVAVQCLDTAGDNCPPNTTQIVGSLSTSSSQEFGFTVRDKTPVLVTLTVSDERGATTQDWMFVEVGNRAPVIDQLQRQPLNGPYTLGTKVKVVVEAHDPDPDDTLSFSARLVNLPRGSLPDNRSFALLEETASGATWELEGDIADTFFVEVTVSDGTGGDAEQTVQMIGVPFAEDEAPCIVGTDPLAVTGGSYVVDTAGGVRRFAVTNASDDLDAYPGAGGSFDGEATFKWFIASPDTDGQFVEVSGNVGADFLVDPAAYAPGDMLKLRVEIADRIDRGPLPCADDVATCSYTGVQTCPQRVTWEAEIR